MVATSSLLKKWRSCISRSLDSMISNPSAIGATGKASQTTARERMTLRTNRAKPARTSDMKQPLTLPIKNAAPIGIGFGDWLASPRRIQLSRKAGWKMPPNTVVVSRPSKWGNPWKVGDWLAGVPISRQNAVELFEKLISPHSAMAIDAKTELRGKHLACWCKITDEAENYVPCHADILLALANGMSHDEVRNENLKANKGRTE